MESHLTVMVCVLAGDFDVFEAALTSSKRSCIFKALDGLSSLTNGPAPATPMMMGAAERIRRSGMLGNLESYRGFWVSRHS